MLWAVELPSDEELKEALEYNEPDWRDEDMVNLRQNHYQLDVGWRPGLDPNGCFVCDVIVHDNWETPEETFRTRDVDQVIEWLKNKWKDR